MRRILIGAIGVAGVAATLLVGHHNTKAADHTDGLIGTGQDFADLYAWMDVDADKVNLVATVVGGEFSTASQYVFHVHSGDAYLNTPEETQIICQFAAANNAECWVVQPNGDELYVTGNPSNANDPLTDAGGQVSIFAGPRNDAFFFNIDGFLAVLGAVEGAAAGGLGLDANGCPQVDPATAAALGGLLGSDGAGGPAQDDFAGQTVAAIVVQIDKALLNSGGATLAVWASTHNR